MGFNGFDLEGDSDLDEMLSIAAEGEEFDDSDRYLFDSEVSTVNTPADANTEHEDEVEPVIDTPEPQHEEPVVDSQVEGDTSDSAVGDGYVDYKADNTSAVESGESAVESDSFDSDYNYGGVETNVNTAPYIPQIETTEQEIKRTKRVINILDTYRSLGTPEKSVVSQFIYQRQDVDVNDEAGLVVQVINSDPALRATMKYIHESSLLNERVERLVYILRLTDKELNDLGTLVSMLQDVELGRIVDDRLSYAQQLESAVDKLDANIIQFISATERVLDSAFIDEE